MMQKILITGITGQIGSYIAELYLSQGYEVHGVYRRVGIDHFENIEHIKDQITLHLGDITDSFSMLEIFNNVKPDIVINCAAQSEVGTSFSNPCTTFDITGKGVLNLLEIIRKYYPKCRFLQFSSSEMYGSSFNEFSGIKYQYEQTPFAPMSPYAVAKLAAYHMVKVYRESYGLFASNIIAFNNESVRRKDYFVTRKITKWLGDFLNWKNNSHFDTYDIRFTEKEIVCDIGYTFPKLALGNIDSVRSWTHSKDTANAAKLILDYHNPDDFCIGRQESHTIKDFLQEAFSYKGLNWEDYVYQDEKFMRPNDLTYLRPYTEKSFNLLRWAPRVSFQELVKEMVDSDYEKATKDT